MISSHHASLTHLYHTDSHTHNNEHITRAHAHFPSQHNTLCRKDLHLLRATLMVRLTNLVGSKDVEQKEEERERKREKKSDVCVYERENEICASR